MAASTLLARYRKKRNFQKTPEPGPQDTARKHSRPIFVIQEHHATRLHYDFRLEFDGVLKSWAVPREPSLDPSVKRLAVRVEDHPVSYATFEGTIPKGQYGGGEVSIWDHGTYEAVSDFDRGLDAGKIEFELHGEKLHGRFALVRMHRQEGDKENWLLIKSRDASARKQEAKPEKPRPASRKAKPRERKSGASPRNVELTNPDKVWFPDDGYTKGDVFEYYEAVADRILPFLRDRPMTLERMPEGIASGKPHFWQKHTPEYYPDWIPRVELTTEPGKPVEYVLVNDKATLLYLVNQGTLTFHPWLSRVQHTDRPDFVLLDLDPGEASFANAVEVAKAIHGILDDLGIDGALKTSGKSGLHVLVPWTGEGGYDESRVWARTVAELVVKSHPKLATAEFRKNARGKRVYIDVMQNTEGHHAVPPYVVRPVAGAPVSMPLNWDELTSKLRPGQFTIKTALRRLSRQKTDPIARLLKAIQRKRS
jgi:bifunctional non-homologous end joining protein LigD